MMYDELTERLRETSIDFGECEAYLAFHEHNKVKNHKNRLQSEVNDFINKEIIKSIKGVR